MTAREGRVPSQQGNKIKQNRSDSVRVSLSKDKAENEQGVTFRYPDTKPFQETCEAMHEEMLSRYPDLQPIYDKIQDYNGQHPSEKE